MVNCFLGVVSVIIAPACTGKKCNSVRLADMHKISHALTSKKKEEEEANLKSLKNFCVQ
jgi:hypothetical protein